VWNNVTLVPGEPTALWRPGRLSPATARSARLAEAVWRWSARKVAVPAGVISLLQRSPGYDELRAERNAIVERYAEFLETAEGFSGIGAAGVFRT
jgi:hypothetical protein